MDLLGEALNEEWQVLVRFAPRLLVALTVFLTSFVLGRVFGRGVVHLLSRGQFSGPHKAFFRSLSTWIFVVFGAAAALSVLGLQGLATSLVAGGGVTAIVLGFAFRQIGENFLAGFFLAFSRPFELGDLIQSGDLQGVVKSIDLRSTHVRSNDGRDIFIPSSQIFNNPLINFTRDGLRRVSFTVGIDYGDPAGEALVVLLEAVRKVRHIQEHPPPTVNLSELAPLFVKIEVSFWLDTFQENVDLGELRNEVMENCRQALFSNGFTVSASVASSVELVGGAPIDIRLRQGGPSGLGPQSDSVRE